jgi:peroxin-6
MLYVPLQLLPRYLDVPLRATIRLHRPVAISQLILQPLFDNGFTILDMDELDLGALSSGELRAAECRKNTPNGHMNGNDRPHHRKPVRILREGHSLVMSCKSDGQSLPFRIIMLEPVAQGYLSPDTRVILSTTPYDSDSDHEDDDAQGSIYGESSQGKTHLSMADFDPDTFLSSSLALALHSSSANGETQGDMEQSVSSTSGSITPRPPGAAMRATSPPARPLDLEDVDVSEADTGGTRFGAVVANGNAGTYSDVCWVSVGGLGRAGIFEGDWVSYIRLTEL